MFKSILSAVAAATFVIVSVPGADALAAEQASETKDLRDFACKEVMRLSGEDREIALALLHGYRLGKMGTTRYEVEALAQITDRYLDYCLEHPNENALASFEKIAK